MIATARGRRFMSDINIVPMVDVMLVLLVIFMVTAPLLYRGMEIELPRSETNTITPEERIILTVTKDRKIYLDKDLVSIHGLAPALEAWKEKSPKVSVYLRADRQVPYGLIVQVMDKVKRSGIERLGMVTEPVMESSEE